MEESIQTFIREARDRGDSPEQVIAEMIKVGWTEDLARRHVAVIYSENTPVRTLSTEKRSKKGMLFGLLGVLLVLASAAGGFYLYKNYIQSKPATETNAPQPTPQKNVYTNGTYNFQLTLPDGWISKEYSPQDFNGDARFAFGAPDNIPTTFFSQGDYVWLSVFGVAEKASHSEYAFWQEQADQNTFRRMQLGTAEAVDTGTVIAGEHGDYVYYLYLPVEKDASGEDVYTAVGQQVWASFKFLQ